MYEHQWQRIAKLHESALHMRMQCLMNLRLGHYCSKCKFESVHVIQSIEYLADVIPTDAIWAQGICPRWVWLLSFVFSRPPSRENEGGLQSAERGLACFE